MLVACEGVPALFHFTIRGQGASSALSNVIQLNGNALGVAFVSVSTTAATVVVSVDNVHKPGSVTEVRETEVRWQLLDFGIFVAHILVGSMSAAVLYIYARQSLEIRGRAGEPPGVAQSGSWDAIGRDG